MSTDFKERFAQFFEHVGERQSGFAQRAGIQQVTVSQLLSGRSEASLKTVNKLRAAFPNLNMEWLLEGKGEMLHDASAAAVLKPAPPGDPKQAPIEASPLSVVPETELEKELKREVKWLREQLELWQRIATSGVDLSKVATGTDGTSFPTGSAESAEVIARRASMALAA